MSSIWDGIMIGGAGGAVAGVTVWLVQLAHSKFTESRDKERVYTWLKANTADEDKRAFRSTRAIASWTNLTEDRVRYICSVHGQIYLSTGKEGDMWSLYEIRSRQAQESR